MPQWLSNTVTSSLMTDPSPTTATPSNDTESCSYQLTVSLYSWWLIKAKNDFEGKRLAVAGISSRKDEAMRVFVSAPIVKRYDVFSLETADGTYVIINGFINEERTLENGFSPEVFNHFFYGFPSNWESCALDCFREESTTDTDLVSSVPHIVSASGPEILSDEDAPGDQERLFPENECNVSKEMIGVVNVACSSGRKQRSFKLQDFEVFHQKRQPASGGLLKHPDNENSTSMDLENCDIEGLRSPATPIQPQLQSEFSIDACMESSIPISSVSPVDALRGHKKPFLENENVSKEMGGVNFACSNAGKRPSSRLHDIKECQQKKQPASGGLLKHPDNENSTSVDLENCDEEGLKTPATPIQPQLQSEFSKDACMENSIPISLLSPEDALRDHEKPCPENENVSKEVGRVNFVCSSAGKRRSARLHNIKTCQQKQPASGGLLKHPDNGNSTSVDLENCDEEELRSPATPIQPQFQSMESSIPISLVSPVDAFRGHKKPFLENENVSKEMGGVNFACSNAVKRPSSRLHDIKECQQKKQAASGGLLKHPDNENSTSVDLENCEEEGLRSPTTPIQSQAQRQLSPPPELLVKKSASRISRTSSRKTKGCYEKKSVTVETKAVRPSGRLNKSASAVKSPQEKDPRHLIKGNQQKISTVSSQSLSFKKSRSGRLLLPPLEFWRNQIPIYNANHEITEIQDGACLISPCRGSSPSLKRFKNQKRAG